MMKRYLAYSLFATMALGALAATKTDIGSRARLRGKLAPVEMVKSSGGEVRMMKRVRTRAAEEEMVRAFVTMKKGTTAEMLEAAGVTVTAMRRSIALCEFPLRVLEDLEALDCVVAVKTESPVKQKMDKVRSVTGVDKVHGGEGLPQAYTGKGVIAGIVDGGFDPNHINFQDEDGKCRIKQLTVYRYAQDMTGQQRVEQATLSGDKLKSIDTEAEDSYHATHTTGIMAEAIAEN